MFSDFFDFEIHKRKKAKGIIIKANLAIPPQLTIPKTPKNPNKTERRIIDILLSFFLRYLIPRVKTKRVAKNTSIPKDS